MIPERMRFPSKPAYTNRFPVCHGLAPATAQPRKQDMDFLLQRRGIQWKNMGVIFHHTFKFKQRNTY
jgi:hypothetical protein